MVDSSSNFRFGDPLSGFVQEPDYKQMLADSVVLETDVIDTPPVCIEIGNDGDMAAVGTLGNISTVIAKAKQGKTFTISLAVGAAVAGDDTQSPLRVLLPKSKNTILVFDTEQSKYHTQKVLKRIRVIAGGSHKNNLIVRSLRKYNPAQRLGMIEWEIENTEGVGLVVIDGIRDLVTSINDEAESTMICSKLLKWTEEKNFHLITVLHMNKGDQNARGHLGTELTNKSETVLSVSKSIHEKGVSIIQPEYCRGKEWAPIAFKIDEDGIPSFIENWSSSSGSQVKKVSAGLPQDIDNAVHLAIINDAFNRDQPKQSWSELKKSVQYHAARHFSVSIGEGKAETYIRHWLFLKFIKLEGKAGTVAAKYSVN